MDARRPGARPTHARPGLPPGQGAAARPGAASRPGRRARRGRRPPDAGRLSRGVAQGGHPAAVQRRRGGRPGRGGQAAHLQGDRPGPARGHARRLPQLQLPARDRRHRRRAGRPGGRASCATRTRPSRPVEDRGAKDGDYAVISFIGTRDGEPFEGGTSERMPLILGQERLIPGFEIEPRRAQGRATRRSSTSRSRTTTARPAWPARTPTSRSSSRSCARRSSPTSTTTSSRASATSDRSRRCAPTSGPGWRAMPSIAPATASPTRSSSTPSRTRPSSCPTC